MRRFGPVIAASIIAGFVCWFFGVGIIPAIVIFIAVAAIGIVLRVPSTAISLDWPTAPLPPSDGDRHESSELSWAIRTRGAAVDQRVVRRLSRIASNRLALRQLDLDNPSHRTAIVKLIGEPAYVALRNPNAQKMRLPDIVTILDILDSLQRPARTDSAPTIDPNSKK